MVRTIMEKYPHMSSRLGFALVNLETALAALREAEKELTAVNKKGPSRFHPDTFHLYYDVADVSKALHKILKEL
jgi:hypothetical protein